MHDWFEGRRAKCTLLVFIDDATSKIVQLKFVEAETTQAYFGAMKEYLAKYGKPRAIYTDKHVVFKVNTPGGKKTNGLTSFGYALKRLHIESIFAHSPQAKGRVERANSTLQDRLVKDLRFYNIKTIEEANIYLEKYIDCFNNKFSVKPESPKDLHQPLTKREEKTLDVIFSVTAVRRASKDLLVKHLGITYKITNVGKGHRIKGQKVKIHSLSDGSIEIFYKNKKLQYEIAGEAQYKQEFADRKTVDLKTDSIMKTFILHQKINNKATLDGNKSS